QEQRNVTQEKERRHDVRAPLPQKFFLGALRVSAVRSPYCTVSVTTSPCCAPPGAVASPVTGDAPSARGETTVRKTDPGAAPVARVAVTVTVAGFGTTAGGVY